MDKLSQNFSQAELAVRKEIGSLLKVALAKNFNKKFQQKRKIKNDYKTSLINREINKIA